MVFRTYNPLNMFRALIIMPIIRISILYRRLQLVAHNTSFKAGRVVCCGVVGYASGLRDVVRATSGLMDVARATSLNPNAQPTFPEQTIRPALNKVLCAKSCNHLYILELLMMGIMVPETC
jgi:hypothetical protein